MRIVQRGQAFKVGLVLASPLIVYFAAFFIYPLFNLLQNAFTSDSGAFTIANFRSMLSDPILDVSLTNTAYYFVGSVTLEYSVGFMVAVLLYAYTGRLRSIFRTIIFLPLMVSPVVIGLMWLLNLNTNYGPLDYVLGPLGLGNTNWIGSQSLAMPSLILANTWEYSPFVFLIIYAGL